MASEKQKKARLSFRAGTDLTYNIQRGSTTMSRTLRDIEYIKPIDDVFLALSLNTGITALGETPENAYSSLIFKLYNSLRDAMNTPGTEIGEGVSEELRRESSFASRMPIDRQRRALEKGLEDFLASHRKTGRLVVQKIEFLAEPNVLSTDNLADTAIAAIVGDTLVDM